METERARVMKSTLKSGLALSLVLAAGACGTPEPTGVAGAGQLRLGAVLGGESDAGFRRADRVVPLSFPVDHGAHPDFRSEWWYLTLVLESGVDSAPGPTEEAVFGVQFTLFRQALAPAPAPNAWSTPQVFLAHFALTDVAAGSHRAHERSARGHPQLAGVQTQPFRAWLEDWVLEEDALTPDVWHLRLASAAHTGVRDAVDLTLDARMPPVLQGEDGLSSKGPDQASYYYSIPRMPVSGSLTSAGRTYSVEGNGWLDREWSTSVLGAGQAGWDWFALTLMDGRSLMVFQLRRKDGVRDSFDQGLLIESDGSTRHPSVADTRHPSVADTRRLSAADTRRLSAADFVLTPLRYWTDDWGVKWPVEWRLSLDGEDYRLAAAVDDQRMDTTITYWEGLIDVFAAEGNRIGQGYMELTGYDADPG